MLHWLSLPYPLLFWHFLLKISPEKFIRVLWYLEEHKTEHLMWVNKARHLCYFPIPSEKSHQVDTMTECLPFLSFVMLMLSEIFSLNYELVTLPFYLLNTPVDRPLSIFFILFPLLVLVNGCRNVEKSLYCLPKQFLWICRHLFMLSMWLDFLMSCVYLDRMCTF